MSTFVNSFVAFHSYSRVITVGTVQAYGVNTETWNGYFHSTLSGSPSDAGSIDNSLVFGFATIVDFYAYDTDAVGGTWFLYLNLYDNGGGTIDSTTVHSFQIGSDVYTGLTYTNLGGGYHQFSYTASVNSWGSTGSSTTILIN